MNTIALGEAWPGLVRMKFPDFFLSAGSQVKQNWFAIEGAILRNIPSRSSQGEDVLQRPFLRNMELQLFMKMVDNF